LERVKETEERDTLSLMAMEEEKDWKRGVVGGRVLEAEAKAEGVENAVAEEEVKEGRGVDRDGVRVRSVEGGSGKDNERVGVIREGEGGTG
jgi:hypothetical protein